MNCKILFVPKYLCVWKFWFIESNYAPTVCIEGISFEYSGIQLDIKKPKQLKKATAEIPC